MLKVKALRDVSEADLVKIKDELSEADYQKALYVIQENHRVLEFIEAAKQSDVKTMGELLYISHQGLSKQYKVSCKELDFLVDFARSTKGVVGARMMGGGFGG